jgi:hypothetical protein
VPPDAATLAARRELALQRRKAADAVLKALAANLAFALTGLCVEDREQAPGWTFPLRRGLFELAAHFGLIKVFHR